MTDPYQTTLDAVTKALKDRGLVYTGAKYSEIEALGSQFARASQGHPYVASELGYVASVMALDAEGYYEAAITHVDRTRATVNQLQSLVDEMFLGPDGILLWSPASLTVTQIAPDRLRNLLNIVRRSRFVRSGVTEEVHTDLYNETRAAADELARLQADPDFTPATLPNERALENLRSEASALEVSIQGLLSLPDEYSSVDWRAYALQRMLGHFDADLTASLVTIEEGDVQEGVQRSFAHTVLALEVIERLLSQPTPFGELLAPDVKLSPKPDLKTKDVRLRPIPENVYGRRSFPFQVMVGETVQIRTCIREDGSWDHPTWFEQGLVVRPALQQAGWVDLGSMLPKHSVLLEMPSVEMKLTQDGEDLPIWITQHALTDHITPTSYSLNYANGVYPSYNVVIEEPATLPVAGQYFRHGALGGPRLKVDTVAASSITLTNVEGTFRELLISDPFNDLGVPITSYLQTLAATPAPPMEAALISAFEAFDVGVFPTSSLDVTDATAEGVRVYLHLDDPFDTYYGSPFDAALDQAVDLLGVGDLGSYVRFTTAWPSASPYGDRGWSAQGFLYRQMSTSGTTNTFCLGTTLSTLIKSSLVDVLRGRHLRFVDPTGVESPVTALIVSCGVRESDLVPGDDNFLQEDDLFVVIDDFLSTSVAWSLHLQVDLTQGSQVSCLEIEAQSPWRSWEGLSPDIAPGDTLWGEDGQRTTVWTTNGCRAYVTPPIDLTGSLRVHRVRHVQVGDRLLLLDDDPDVLSVWKITGILVGDSEGYLEAKSVRGSSVGIAEGTHYQTPGVFSGNQPNTHRFEVLESQSDELVDLDMQETRFRTLLSKETTSTRTLNPVRWYIRTATGLQNASMHGEFNLVTRGLSRPCPSEPIPAQFVVRIKGDGYSGTLDVKEVWVDEQGTAKGECPAGLSHVYDLIRRTRIGIPSLRLPEDAGAVDVRTSTQLRGSVQGPLVRGGSPRGHRML